MRCAHVCHEIDANRLQPRAASDQAHLGYAPGIQLVGRTGLQHIGAPFPHTR